VGGMGWRYGQVTNSLMVQQHFWHVFCGSTVFPHMLVALQLTNNRGATMPHQPIPGALPVNGIWAISGNGKREFPRVAKNA